jgi:hypothetical protein
MPENNQTNGSSNFKGPRKRKNEEFNWNKVFKVVLGWSAILFGFFLIMIWTRSGDTSEIDINYDQYQRLLDSNKIQEAVVKVVDKSYIFHGVLKQPEVINVGNTQVTVKRFSVRLPYQYR